MRKIFTMTVLGVAAVAMPALALENSALGSVNQLQGIKQYVEARLDSLETLINTVNQRITDLETRIQECGDQRMFLDSSDSCVPLWVYDSSGPKASFEGQVVIGSPGNSSYKLDVDGQVRATGYFHNSDSRLKENFSALDGMSIVTALEAVNFDWADGSGHDIGFMAQDVEQILPEIVVTDPNSGLKAVDYAKLVAPLVEAVKTLNTRVAQLEAERQ